MNDRYYLCVGNDNNSTLDNGITVFINKKHKNILVNINIADNTYTNVSNTNRDDLYNELYKKLSAFNFTNAINDISGKYGFSDYISYIVIDDNGVKKYSYNDISTIKDLPYLLKCEEPDLLQVKVDSLYKRPVKLPNPLNPFKKLNNGKIIDISQLNFFNNIPVAANIIENKSDIKVFENYSANKNIVTHDLYRYTGYYSPIFYDIQLFERDEYNLGNYKFDITLTDFGIMKERKIRKINRKGSQLRLANVNDEKSMYPMLDEFGYSVYDFFIFSSTWDLKYYLETSIDKLSNDILSKYTTNQNVVSNNSISTPIIVPNDIGQINNN
jgi:hypothetical protein